MAPSYTVCFTLRADDESLVDIDGAITRQTRNGLPGAQPQGAGVLLEWEGLTRPRGGQL